MLRRHVKVVGRIVVLVVLVTVAGCTSLATPAVEQESIGDGVAADNVVVVYSGRNENLVGPLLQQYDEDNDVTVGIRYGGTAEMAATILEEGANSPADVFFGQDAGALGALARTGRCIELPASVTDQVTERFVSPDGRWVGLSGRARVLVYNTDMLGEADLPASVFDLTGEEWTGKVGWAPTNGSFQAFVTAMRVNAGEDVARRWLEEMLANDVQAYPNNTSIVEAVGKGEVAVGLVNHYYLFRFLSEDPDFPAANYYFPNGDLGAMINVAGVCVIDTSANQAAAVALVGYLLSDEAQQYFANETNEYPLVNHDLAINPAIRPLADIDSPDFDLNDIEDLQGTLTMLQEVGALDQ